jgi:hypothetical protein
VSRPPYTTPGCPNRNIVRPTVEVSHSWLPCNHAVLLEIPAYPWKCLTCRCLVTTTFDPTRHNMLTWQQKPRCSGTTTLQDRRKARQSSRRFRDREHATPKWRLRASVSVRSAPGSYTRLKLWGGVAPPVGTADSVPRYDWTSHQ